MVCLQLHGDSTHEPLRSMLRTNKLAAGILCKGCFAKDHHAHCTHTHTLAPALSHTRGCGDNQLYTLTCAYALEYVKDNLFDAKKTLSRLSLFMSKHADLVRMAAPAMCVCVCKHVRTRVRVLLCVEGRGQTINEYACVYGERGERGPERALT